MMSSKASITACPACSTPVALGGGRLMVKGFLSDLASATKALDPSHFL